MCFDRPVTVVALKRLGAGVFAVVPCQLVAPGKSPLASLPRALVRLLTWGVKRKKTLSNCFISHPPIAHLFVFCGTGAESGTQMFAAFSLMFDAQEFYFENSVP